MHNHTPLLRTPRHHVRAAALCAAVALMVSAAGVSPVGAYVRPGQTVLVSRAITGRPALASGFLSSSQYSGVSVSGTGRFVAFESDAIDLVPTDKTPFKDIFVRDLAAGTTVLASQSSQGLPGLGVCGNRQQGSRNPSISTNGRFVSFSSCSTNLVSGDSNAVSDVFVHDLLVGRTERVSRGRGAEANADSMQSSISGNGRYVAFTSVASNLVPGDSNGVQDVFVYDRQRQSTRRVSLTNGDRQTPGESRLPSIDSTGRFVGFVSTGDDLVPGDTNRQADYFIRDLQLGRTERVSVATGGAQATGGNLGYVSNRAVSSGGRYVAFDSLAGNLVPNKASGLFSMDSYVHDRRTRRTVRVSVTSFGEEGYYGTPPAFLIPSTSGPQISNDGRFVAFATNATNLHTGDADHRTDPAEEALAEGDADVFIHDLRTGTTRLASVTLAGTAPSCAGAGTRGESWSPAISGTGAHVAFDSCGHNLAQGDERVGVTSWQIYARNVGRDLAVMAEASAPSGLQVPDGTPPITGGAGGSGAAAAVAGAADLVGASVSYRARLRDIRVTLEAAKLPSLSAGLAGLPAVSGRGVLHGVSFTAEGHHYELRAAAAGLTPQLGLFVCDAKPCQEVATLRGGYGTTGDRIMFTVPSASLGLTGRSRLSSVEAFSALGTYLTGAAVRLDAVRLPEVR